MCAMHNINLHTCKVLCKQWPSTLDSYLKKQHTHKCRVLESITVSAWAWLIPPSRGVQGCLWYVGTKQSTTWRNVVLYIVLNHLIERDFMWSTRRLLSLFNRTWLLKVVQLCAMKQCFMVIHTYGICTHDKSEISISAIKVTRVASWQERTH